MSQPSITVPFGSKTYAFLSECATCGKPYRHPDEGWRTAYTYSEKTKTGMWLIYCADCYDKLEKVGE